MGKWYLFNVYTFCKSLCVINEGSPYGLHGDLKYILYLYDHMWLVGYIYIYIYTHTHTHTHTPMHLKVHREFQHNKKMLRHSIQSIPLNFCRHYGCITHAYFIMYFYIQWWVMRNYSHYLILNWINASHSSETRCCYISFHNKVILCVRLLFYLGVNWNTSYRIVSSK